MPIELIPYEPKWSAEFEKTRHEIVRSLAPEAWIAVEHVGSTAVPGLCAKPIVDILIGIESLGNLKDIERALVVLGFTPWHSGTNRNSFERKNEFEVAAHHAHVVAYEGSDWVNQIAFRNHLRMNEDARVAYEVLKKRLAFRFSDTRDYSEAKSDFIAEILAICT